MSLLWCIFKKLNEDNHGAGGSPTISFKEMWLSDTIEWDFGKYLEGGAQDIFFCGLILIYVTLSFSLQLKQAICVTSQG